MDINSIDTENMDADYHKRKLLNKNEMIKPRLKKDFQKQKSQMTPGGDIYKNLSGNSFNVQGNDHQQNFCSMNIFF